MKKRIVSLVLMAALASGLAVPAFAYTTPDFTDLPSDNWAYESVMRMADAGVIKGTGGGAFSPEMKVSVAQFLTLVGRVVFPDVKAEGEDWYGPYISAAQEGGLLTGTQVDTSKPGAEISRYDMAVILRGAAQKLGKSETLAQQSQVADYGLVPIMYADAVLAVYGMGLIQGDQNGNFNGTNTMMRNETATVMDRLIALKNSSDPSGTTTEPEKPSEPEAPEMYIPKTNNTKTLTLYGYVRGVGGIKVKMAGIQLALFYKDGRMLAQTVTDAEGKWSMEFTVDASDYKYSRSDYYVGLLAPFEYDGWQYIGGSRSPWSLQDMNLWEDGFAVDFR